MSHQTAQQNYSIAVTATLTAEHATALYAEARRLGTTSSELIAEIVGKVLGDNLVDAVLNR